MFSATTLAAEAHIQSVLDPAGVQADTIHHLWLLMLWVTTAVFVIVVVVVVVALARGRRRREHNTAVTTESTLTTAVAAAAGATVVILIALLAASVWTTRSTAALQASNAVSVAVTGHQWWWEVEYEDAVASRRVVTANELHIPVNRPVVLKVTSRDVIHSFWAPNLQGKRDLIPGYTTAIWMQAARVGTFRGQCAEFCGLQHAHMAFDVVAEPEGAFERWLDKMREPARPPATDEERRGQDVFMTARCAGCHTILGTDARGQTAPDLTHIASRRALAAGTLPNTPEHLAMWILDPQASKPGNQMPPNVLAADDLRALVDYMRTLK